MRLAIISDSHDNIVNIQRFLTWAEKNEIDVIIHCGDLASPSMIDELLSGFGGEIHLVHGNVSDRDNLEKVCDKYPKVTLHGDEGSVDLGGIKIGFCHFPDQAKDMGQTGKFRLVFYGHSHQPWMETLDNKCQLVNPGTLGGLFQPATFAHYDTESGNLELKLLNDLDFKSA